MARTFSKLTVVLMAALLLAATLPALAEVDCNFIQSDPEDREACEQGNPDGRVNPGAVEAAIYCTTQGVKIIDIDIRGVATWSFLVPYDDIDEIGISEENTLIRERRGFRLYRLTTGELQLNAPPNWRNSGEYVFIWDGCDQSSTLQP